MSAKAVDLDVSAVECAPDELTLTWRNSSYSVYSSMWLRDNDPAHRDDPTGQRLVSVLDLPAEPQLRSAVAQPPGYLSLSWESGATSVYPLRWLRSFDVSLRVAVRPTRMPWMGQPVTAFASCGYAEWAADPASREDWLVSVGRNGLGFLRDVPTELGTVARVAAAIGGVRETMDGRIFDVPSLSKENNVAYTHCGVRVHTDYPYGDPVPGFQLLHGLSEDGQRGETIFVDGMAAAERLRAHSPEAFHTLCQTPVRFRRWDAAVDLVAERTMLEVDTQGQFRAIHYNDQAIAPLRLQGPLLKRYYLAYRQLAELLSQPARSVTCSLSPGDLVLFDNTRVLHGRSAFSVAPDAEQQEMHLQGCYLDADGFYSSLAVLSRLRSS